MNNYINNIRVFLLDLLFPKFCLGCEKESVFLCEDCRSLLDISEFNYCLCDKHPIRLPAGLKNNKCQRCRHKKLAGLYFALPYKEKFLTRKLIYQFKYQPYIKNLAETLASIINEHFIISGNKSDELFKDSILIPVPLEKKKLKSRGYNQSEELAKELSKLLWTPMLSDILIKTKPTKSQMELSKEEREGNLKGVFIARNPEQIKNKKIFLVDDVYTTGSTMEECVAILLGAGAKSVWGITISRED